MKSYEIVCLGYFRLILYCLAFKETPNIVRNLRVESQQNLGITTLKHLRLDAL